MEFVSEQIIDEAILSLEKEIEAKDTELLMEDMGRHQPAVLSYLLSEAFKLLTQKEREYLVSLSMVIWRATRKVNPNAEPVDPRTLEEKEEDNWEKLEEVPAGSFRDRLDIFFKDYPQEDLLAFAEDALVEEEEEEDSGIALTKEGKELMFVALKTIIDCLTME